MNKYFTFGVHFLGQIWLFPWKLAALMVAAAPRGSRPFIPSAGTSIQILLQQGSSLMCGAHGRSHTVTRSSILRQAARWVNTGLALGTAALNLCGGQNNVSQNPSGAWLCIFVVSRNRRFTGLSPGEFRIRTSSPLTRRKAVLQRAEVSYTARAQRDGAVKCQPGALLWAA